MPDLGVHDAAISAFTMARFRRSRWREIRTFMAPVAGTYYVRVKRYPGSATGAYSLMFHAPGYYSVYWPFK
jgi:hypothetical protein